MKAAWFEQFGGAEDVMKVGELPTPQPGPGEVLVRMYSSAVNPSDVKKRAGAFPDLLDEGLVIPHSDGAGIIESVGDGCDQARIGQRVWVYQAQFQRRMGSAAEYVAIADELAPRLPGAASFAEGACLGIPAMTAHRCVYADGPVAGNTLLVTGGAGRVGAYAIQWAVASGARVITTASNEQDASLCRALGAVAVCNHREVGWAREVLNANSGQPVDRVVDVEFGANLPEILDCIRVGGTIATYSSTQVKEPALPFLRMMYMDLTVRMVIVYAMPDSAKQAAIADIHQALVADKLRHRVSHSLPLAEVARAHQLIERGERGCVVLDLS